MKNILLELKVGFVNEKEISTVEKASLLLNECGKGIRRFGKIKKF